MTLPLLLLSLFTFVELNCENLFDCRHDSLKNDTEFLPEGSYRWTPTRYWQKLNRVGQTIISCGEPQISEQPNGDSNPQSWQLPDLVALCEVENDSVIHDLTKRSLLRNARYEYVMTNSPDGQYGGVKPRRNYIGPRYNNGFSDHLPLVATFRM